MKFFWKVQQKYLKTSSSGVLYHPMIIRYCLSPASNPATVYNDSWYNEKAVASFLIQPRERRLCYYRNFIKSKRQFNNEMISEWLKKLQISLIMKFLCAFNEWNDTREASVG